MSTGRGNDSAADILLPPQKVPASVPDSEPSKTDIASRAIRANWGVMANPRARAAIAALTCHYQYLDPLAGDIQILGDNIYFSISAWMKELHNQVPLNCRRWLKRHATPEEYNDLSIPRWERNDRQNRNGYVGHGSRLWFVQLQVRPWKYGSVQAIGTTGISLAEPLGFEEHWWFTVSEAIGEASDINCDLTIAAGGAKLKADARVLDAMAIKRGQHEVLQESFSLTIRGSRSANEVKETLGQLTFQRGDAELQNLTPGDAGGLPTEPRGFADHVDGETKRRDLEAAMRKLAEESGIPPRMIDEVVAQAMGTDEPQLVVEREAERIKAQAGAQPEGDVPFAPGESRAESPPASAPKPERKPRRSSQKQNPPDMPAPAPESDPLATPEEQAMGEGGEPEPPKY